MLHFFFYLWFLSLFIPGNKRSWAGSTTQAQFKIPFRSDSSLQFFLVFFLVGCTRTESKRSWRKFLLRELAPTNNLSPAIEPSVLKQAATSRVLVDKSQLASHCYPVAPEKLQAWEHRCEGSKLRMRKVKRTKWKLWTGAVDISLNEKSILLKRCSICPVCNIKVREEKNGLHLLGLQEKS